MYDCIIATLFHIQRRSNLMINVEVLASSEDVDKILNSTMSKWPHRKE
jgi:hypothetical protein